MNAKLMENPFSKNLSKTRQLVLTSLLFAVALVLSIVEDSLPQLPIAVPGVKFGLSNIAIMYALFFLGIGNAFSLAILKTLFVFISKGMIAGILSLFGGILSIIIMILLLCLFKEKISYFIISILGAVFHNIGQFIGISIIYKNVYLWSYLPVLIVSGLFAGIITATLLRLILPAFKRLNL